LNSSRDKDLTIAAIDRLIGAVLLIRIATSLVIAAVTILPLLHEGEGLYRAILAALPFFLAAAGGFALNDFHDKDKDAINKPYRAIPSHRVSPRGAQRVGVTLISLACVASLVASRSPLELTLYLGAIAGVSTYNYLVKNFTLSKNVVTSIVSALPIVFVVIVLHYPLIYLTVPVASLSFLLGREWLMDIRDMKGDALSGIKTLPLLIGPKKTARLGFFLVAASVIILLPLAVAVQTAWSVILLGLMTASTTLLVALWYRHKGTYERGVVLGLWFPMGCGILILIR
jgi:geranylgeranylglycerol-phosphate geranylgeranyltransferase